MSRILRYRNISLEFVTRYYYFWSFIRFTPRIIDNYLGLDCWVESLPCDPRMGCGRVEEQEQLLCASFSPSVSVQSSILGQFLFLPVDAYLVGSYEHHLFFCWLCYFDWIFDGFSFLFFLFFTIIFSISTARITVVVANCLLVCRVLTFSDIFMLLSWCRENGNGYKLALIVENFGVCTLKMN